VNDEEIKRQHCGSDERLIELLHDGSKDATHELLMYISRRVAFKRPLPEPVAFWMGENLSFAAHGESLDKRLNHVKRGRKRDAKLNARDVH
jgi:hypothetical protein